MRLLPKDYLKITNSTIYNQNVCQDIKISSLGDLHISPIVPEDTLDNLKYTLDRQHANYICLLGDLIDLPSSLEDEKDSKKLLDFLKACASIAPTIVIWGNHDFIDLDFKPHNMDDFWEEVSTLNNLHLLKDDFCIMDQVLFMGYFQKYEYWYPLGGNYGYEDREDLQKMHDDLVNLKHLYTNLPENVVKIGLIHSPEFIKDENLVSMFGAYDLIMCGHYHEGCTPAILDDFPTHRGLITPKREKFPAIAKGVITLSTGTYLIIDGGIVKVQYSASRKLWPFNSICYQHMEVITLTGDKEVFPYEITRKRVYTKKR